ncbi:Cytochrome b5 [Platanthera zijinensis]|uniref:Cytochrome b5 n=1 Tax=Platanthera zijinensis TaxID=2320716 RepID=A0AAP0GBN1_9ASPA
MKRAAKGKSAKIDAKKSRSSALDESAETSRIIGCCMQEPPRIQISSSLYTIPEAISELETMPKPVGISDVHLPTYPTVRVLASLNLPLFRQRLLGSRRKRDEGMGGGEDEAKVYTLLEVTKHSSREDCWLIINGKVFRRAPFHPHLINYNPNKHFLNQSPPRSSTP